MPLVVIVVAVVLKLTLDAGPGEDLPRRSETPPVPGPADPAPEAEAAGGLAAPTLGDPEGRRCQLVIRLSAPLPALPGVAHYVLVLRRPGSPSGPARARAVMAPTKLEARFEDLRPGPYAITLRAEPAADMQGQAEIEIGSVELAARAEERALPLPTGALRQAVADAIRPR
jgi:hypothetical protein